MTEGEGPGVRVKKVLNKKWKKKKKKAVSTKLFKKYMMKNYLIHNDIHINHDMAANTQEASNSIRQGKWLRNPVFIYCCESLGSMLNLSFLDRYLP